MCFGCDVIDRDLVIECVCDCIGSILWFVVGKIFMIFEEFMI